MAETVYVRGKRADVRRALREIPNIVAGTEADPSGLVQAMMVRAGLAVLGRIKKAFVDKARGGADECGLSWPPLARSTVAYGRRHPGVLWPGSCRGSLHARPRVIHERPGPGSGP